MEIDPKIVLFKHFEQILTDFSLSLNYKMEFTPSKPWRRLFKTFRRLFGNNYDVVLTFKTALGEHLVQFSADFGLLLNYNLEITPTKPGLRLFMILRILF